MTTPEEIEPEKKKILSWKVVLGVVVILILIGQFTGGSESSDTQKSKSPQVNATEAPAVDIFTQRACRKFREFALEGGKGILTIAEMREKFRVSYEAAQFSEIPEIVNSATRTLAALTTGDVEAFSEATKEMADACLAAGR